MADALRVYRLHLALALVGVGTVATALAATLHAVSFGGSSSQKLLEACRSFVVPHLTPSTVVVLALGSLSFAAMARTLRSAVRQVRGRRRFLRRLVRLESMTVGLIPVTSFHNACPHAFCAGLVHPRIYVSSGALEALDSQQLEAVLAHEAHHARRRDPLRIFLVRVLSDGLFFFPVLGRLADRYQRLAELDADAAAVRATGDGGPLAAALLAFEASASPQVVGIAPERVDHLLGSRPRWELPVALVLAAVLVTGGIVALALRTVQAGGPHPVDLPLVLAELCMIAMAAAPLLVGAGGLLLARRGSRRLSRA